jgi:hypothetical protein
LNKFIGFGEEVMGKGVWFKWMGFFGVKKRFGAVVIKIRSAFFPDMP